MSVWIWITITASLPMITFLFVYLYLRKNFDEQIVKSIIAPNFVVTLIWIFVMDVPFIFTILDLNFDGKIEVKEFPIYFSAVSYVIYLFVMPCSTVSDARGELRKKELHKGKEALATILEKEWNIKSPEITNFDFDKTTLQLTLKELQELSNQKNLPPETIVKLPLRYEDGNWKIKASRAIY